MDEFNRLELFAGQNRIGAQNAARREFNKYAAEKGSMVRLPVKK